MKSSTKINLDEIDHQILKILHRDARISMTALGKLVHLTSQAVKNRLDRLNDLGIVNHYTVNVNCPVYGYKIHVLLNLQVERNMLSQLTEYLRHSTYHILHFYQTTGTQSYTIDSYFTDDNELHEFLSEIQKFATCEIQMVLQEIPLRLEKDDAY